ncbi:MAG: hypothetical protein F4X92_04885, partial [Gammaproteobacteria bacterium]|nr:hypothetical protein [Gammaproteobacteria bacterium]
MTVPAGETEAAFTVATADDGAAGPDGTVTVEVSGDGEEGRRYVPAAPPDHAASVRVSDRGAAAVLQGLSVGDVTVREREGFAWFTVRLPEAAGVPFSVRYRTRHSSPVSAREGVDYLRAGWHLEFGPEDTERRFWVYVFNDSHDEGTETFEVELSHPTGGVSIADGVAVGTIVNVDPMPAAWLSRFGRTLAEQALDGMAGRIAAPREPGTRGTVAGHAFGGPAVPVPEAGHDGRFGRA